MNSLRQLMGGIGGGGGAAPGAVSTSSSPGIFSALVSPDMAHATACSGHVSSVADGVCHIRIPI